MSKLFAIQKKYGYKKARPDQEEYENVRIAPNVARVGNKIVNDGGIGVSIESKVSKAAFTDIKNLLQSKFPGWQIDPQSVTKDDDFDTDSKNVLFFDIVKNKSVKEVNDSMDTDDSVNPFPSLMPDEKGKFDRMMGLIDQNIEPRLGQVKSVIDGAREQGYADRTIFSVLARHPLVKDSIEALVDDGFEFQDIVDFFATDFSQNEEIAGYKAGVQMEEAEGQFQSFDWNTIDQQGNPARLVVDTGTNDAGEEVIRVGHPNTGGTLAMFTKNDILNNDGYLRVAGRNFQVQPSLINWANS